VVAARAFLLRSEDPMSGRLRVVPLGGLGEIGMNCLALEQRGEVLLVDCGVTFDDRGLGVDVVHPDFACLEPFRGRIAGVFLTHGHEDHIGALPYFLRRFAVPVWGPRYALGLVRERLAEAEITDARLIETAPRTRYEVGSFAVEPVRVTHSIADATALAIWTDAGTVVHTGDFKIDETPPDGETFDAARLSALGDEGVALLLSDSTNVDSEGPTGSEQGVGVALDALVQQAEGRVVAAIFASNVHRLAMLGTIARKHGRKIVPLGRSVLTHSRVAHATGYLHWPDDLVVDADQAASLPRRAVLGIATGTQAEANAALARLSRGEHPLPIEAGDTVVLSSRIIPGHERDVFALIAALLRRGVDVRTRVSDRGVHVSGHAHRVDQRRMISLVRPRAFVPVHGTLHHLVRHAALAREAGVPSVTVLENGVVAEIGGEDASQSNRWPTGRVHVFAGRALSPGVLRERTKLAAEGVALVVVPIDADGRVVGHVRITTLGVLDEEEDGGLLAEGRREAAAAVNELQHRGSIDEAALAEAARLAVRRTLARTLGWKPQTVVSVLRVGSA
jgi:ribonuclease J